MNHGGIAEIPVEQPTGVGCASNAAWTGNVEPLQFELRHALERLVRTGETHIVDLRALPLSPAEDEALVAWLGEGEVRAELSVLGRSEVRETAFAGIWLVTHFTDGGAVCGRFLEITRCPRILQTPEPDLHDALREMDARMAQASVGGDTDGEHHE